MNWKKNLAIFGLAMAAASQAAVSLNIANAQATEGAKKLYNFLATNYGQKTVSGVMTGDIDTDYTGKVEDLVDVKAVKDISGKEPVLVGFDFLFATGLRPADDSGWRDQYTQRAITLAKELWSKGGIPAFTWHWKDPADGIESYKPDEITFKFENAYTLENGTLTWKTESAEYGQIKEDIAKIIDLFKQLQEAGVAAIWRPLHEASGNISSGGTAWFWWGANGAVPCKELYNLIYDEFTAAGVNNLIWDWNPQMANDTDWKPKYYDVISLDIYEASDYTTKFVKGYQDLKTNYEAENKMFAISENGYIPDISAMHKNNTVFSWWMPWYESPTWSGYFVTQTKENVWKANMEDECTITLDEMPGWNTYTISNETVAACTPSYDISTMDISVKETEVAVDTTNGNGWMKATFNTIETILNPENPADTLIKPAAQLIINLDAKTKAAQAAAKTITIKAINPASSGVWFTVASLTGAPDWSWQQAGGDGCWLNPKTTEVTPCELPIGDIDFSKSNTLYILVATEGFSGSLYFDELYTDVGSLSTFDTKAELFKGNPQDSGSVRFVKSVELIGSGKGKTTQTTPTGDKQAIKASVAAVSKFSVSGNHVMLSAATAGLVSVDVFSMSGKRVATLFRGNLAAGTHSFDMSDLSKGQYIVRVKGAGLAATQPVVIK